MTHNGIRELTPGDYELVYESPHQPPRECQLTVVTPTYNRGQRLVNQLHSLAQQECDFSKIEMVIVDDGGDPDDLENVKKVELPFCLRIYRQPRQGRRVGRARNIGIKEARGDVVLFLDADALASPRVVQEHLTWHQRKEKIGILGKMHELKPNQLGVHQRFGRWDIPHGGVLRFFKQKMHHDFVNLFAPLNPYPDLGFCTMHASVKRKHLLQANGFDESFDGCWGDEDLDLGYRLEKLGIRFKFKDWAYVYHQWHPVTLDENIRDNRLRLMLKHPEVIPCFRIAGQKNLLRECTVEELRRLYQLEEESLRAPVQARPSGKVLLRDDPHPDIQPVLTLLVFTYGRENFVETFLQSLKHQTLDLKMIEVIFLGRENTEALESSLRSAGLPCKTLVIGQPEEGFNSARIRNDGMKAATSDLIIFTNSDSILDRRFLEEHYHCQQNQSNIIATGCVYPMKAKESIPAEALSTGDLGRYASLRFRWKFLCNQILYPFLWQQSREKKYPLGTIVSEANCSFHRTAGEESFSMDEQFIGSNADEVAEFFHRLIHSGQAVVYLHTALAFQPWRPASGNQSLIMENQLYFFMRHLDLLFYRFIRFKLNPLYRKGISDVRCYRLWYRRLRMLGKQPPRFLFPSPLRKKLVRWRRLILPAVMFHFRNMVKTGKLPLLSSRRRP